MKKDKNGNFFLPKLDSFDVDIYFDLVSNNFQSELSVIYAPLSNRNFGQLLKLNYLHHNF